LADKEGMLALSIRQPYAELILRGIKTIEYRSRPTRIVGERFWIYASKTKVTQGKGRGVSTGAGGGIWSGDLSAGEDVAPWLVELANGLALFPGPLPVGVIVGSAVVDKVVEHEALRHVGTEARREETSSAPSCLRASVPPCLYEWHLRDVRRVEPRKPERRAQPVWFRPFSAA
jgi:hypothetical protein